MKDIRRSTGKNTHLSKMGHRTPPEQQWHPRSEEAYAGPPHVQRGPRSERPVAIIGASEDRAKFGNKAVRAYAEDGYTVWPVNPKGGEIEGRHVYRDLNELPEMPFAVAVYLHEAQALPVLDELADRETAEHTAPVVVYLPPGADTGPVVDRARQLGEYAVNTCPIQAIGHDPGEYPDG